MAADRDLIAARLAARKGHYMPPSLLDSQLATLEPPGADEQPITVSIEPPPEAIVDEVMRQLAGPAPAIPGPLG
jgi:gluconate kinase